jgi:hypothetical protein
VRSRHPGCAKPPNVAYDIGGILFSALGGALIPAAELPGWARAIGRPCSRLV